MSKRDVHNLHESLLEVVKIDSSHRKICKSAAKILLEGKATKSLKGMPVERNTIAISNRRAYHPSVFSSYMLCFSACASVGLDQITNNESIYGTFPVELSESQRLYSLDDFELYLRGRWIAYAEKIRNAINLINGAPRLILLDNGLILSQRNMPQTSDSEVIHFFQKTMDPVEVAWDKARKMSDSTDIVGINSSIKSKFTNAVIQGYTLEDFNHDIVNQIRELKEDNPWLGEGPLIRSLLSKNGTRTIFYRLGKEQLGDVVPRALIETGGIVCTYVRSKNAIFQLEFPYYLYGDDVSQYERLTSELLWLANFQLSGIPVPLLYARELAKKFNMRKTLNGMVRMAKKMSGV